MGETYQPLSRPIFLYVSRTGAYRPEAAAFARFAVAADQAGVLQELGYVPLPPVIAMEQPTAAEIERRRNMK
jgi:phosphate transport system substrate-binding protein